MHLTVLPPPPADVSPALAGPPEDAAPEAVLAWVAGHHAASLAAGRVVATSAFGMEGVVLIDAIAHSRLPIPIIWIDTGFLFAETHELREKLEARYPHVEFRREPFGNLPPATPAELWRHDPDACCAIRKVEPMRRIMQNVDVWLTALRRGQSSDRAHLPLAHRDPKFGVTKICPLITWDRAQIWDRVQRRGLPYNRLHELGYPTVGCTHCTRPVPGSNPATYSRAGRWSGTTKTECGLHGAGI
jgi:phosphoadenylyl-sulfate reductase (thioredoxin)